MAITTAVTYGMAALGAASAHMQNQAADARVEAQNRQIELNNQAVIEQMGENYAALNTEAQKAAAESVQQGMQSQLGAIKSRSEANLMAAASGMGGASVEDMFVAINRDEAKSMSNIIGNYEDRIYEINRNAENVWNQAKGGLQNTLNKPSGWSKAANVITGAIGGYATGSQLGGALDAASPAKGSGLFDSIFKGKDAAPIVQGQASWMKPRASGSGALLR